MPLLELILAGGQTVNVQRQKTAKDADGGATQSPWITLLANQPTMIRPASARIQQMFAQRNIVADYGAMFALNVDTAIPGGIQASDRLQDVAAGLVYLVVGRLPQPLILSGEQIYCAPCTLETLP